jgi:hypothetical protein
MTESKDWLASAIADLERLRGEAHDRGEEMLAYLIDLAVQEANARKQEPAEKITD